MVLEKGSADRAEFALLGYGESSDAYHISAPRPDGAAAMGAMGDALRRASLKASQIDYVNLHGTATPLNDLLEASALAKVVGSQVPCSSTKGWTGHTLGAAGITEATMACMSIRHQWLPGTLNCMEPEPGLGIGLLLSSRPGQVRRAMSNSFGFGGSNCSLVFGSTSC
jgi:3-oxoacyl-[acyl-carrier-protein] synthase-1